MTDVGSTLPRKSQPQPHEIYMSHRTPRPGVIIEGWINKTYGREWVPGTWLDTRWFVIDDSGEGSKYRLRNYNIRRIDPGSVVDPDIRGGEGSEILHSDMKWPIEDLSSATYDLHEDNTFTLRWRQKNEKGIQTDFKCKLTSNESTLQGKILFVVPLMKHGYQDNNSPKLEQWISALEACGVERFQKDPITADTMLNRVGGSKGGGRRKRTGRKRTGRKRKSTRRKSRRKKSGLKRR